MFFFFFFVSHSSISQVVSSLHSYTTSHLSMHIINTNKTDHKEFLVRMAFVRAGPSPCESTKAQ